MFLWNSSAYCGALFCIAEDVISFMLIREKKYAEGIEPSQYKGRTLSQLLLLNLLFETLFKFVVRIADAILRTL